tara:strand:+ start:44372 stop:46159 length:1788 start_codon:yes stop_codon:yes gene_type:complete
MSKKDPMIKYTNRDFSSIKKDLVNYAKKYYPDTYNDFSESGFGSLMLDTVAYVGDMLSFYLDYQANEGFLTTATEFENVLKLARQTGYVYNPNPTSNGIATFFILIPANGNGSAPDTTYMPVLKRGSSFSSDSGARFVLGEDVNFRNGDAVVARVNNSNVPTFYAVKSYGVVSSGVRNVTEVEVGDFEKYKKVRIRVPNISEIISVKDSQNNEYYQVDYLSQNVVYKSATNRDPVSRDQAGEILKPINALRRFTAEYNKDFIDLQFGGSQSESTEVDKVFDPSATLMNISGKEYVTDSSFDPNLLIKNDQMGIAPENTKLTIVYRQNSIENTNTRVGSLNSVGTTIFEYDDEPSLQRATLDTIESSLEVSNESAIVGSFSNLSTEELRIRALNSFGTQNRAVTESDYQALCYSMPNQFGSITRAKVVKDKSSNRRNVNIYTISTDASGKLSPSNVVTKQNLKTWLSKNKMINDSIDILSAFVVNLKINFSVVGDGNTDNSVLQQRCLNSLKGHFSSRPEIGEPLYVTDIYKKLNEVEGVADVLSVNLSTANGASYSDVKYGIEANMSEDGRYLILPKNAIYEIKYPDTDIKGAVI